MTVKKPDFNFGPVFEELRTYENSLREELDNLEDEDSGGIEDRDNKIDTLQVRIDSVENAIDALESVE